MSRNREISIRLLKPYKISDRCPYLSEEQRRLSTLTLDERITAAAEWLMLVESMPRVKPLKQYEPNKTQRAESAERHR